MMQEFLNLIGNIALNCLQKSFIFLNGILDYIVETPSLQYFFLTLLAGGAIVCFELYFLKSRRHRIYQAILREARARRYEANLRLTKKRYGMF